MVGRTRPSGIDRIAPPAPREGRGAASGSLHAAADPRPRACTRTADDRDPVLAQSAHVAAEDAERVSSDRNGSRLLRASARVLP